VQCQLHHFQTLFAAGVRRIAMRRRTRWNEMHFTQAALFNGFQRKAQMSVVDGIKRAAQNADRCGKWLTDWLA